uniref:Uncharacterized protein n=1 Tax=Anguilla anguilla TaxID=7936 RepID=A0A0E9UYD1_ANGAN
MNELINKIKC